MGQNLTSKVMDGNIQMRALTIRHLLCVTEINQTFGVSLSFPPASK